MSLNTYGLSSNCAINFCGHDSSAPRGRALWPGPTNQKLRDPRRLPGVVPHRSDRPPLLLGEFMLIVSSPDRVLAADRCPGGDVKRGPGWRSPAPEPTRGAEFPPTFIV